MLITHLPRFPSSARARPSTAYATNGTCRRAARSKKHSPPPTRSSKGRASAPDDSAPCAARTPAAGFRWTPITFITLNRSTAHRLPTTTSETTQTPVGDPPARMVKKRMRREHAERVAKRAAPARKKPWREHGAFGRAPGARPNSGTPRGSSPIPQPPITVASGGWGSPRGKLTGASLARVLHHPIGLSFVIVVDCLRAAAPIPVFVGAVLRRALELGFTDVQHHGPRP